MSFDLDELEFARTAPAVWLRLATDERICIGITINVHGHGLAVTNLPPPPQSSLPATV